MNWLDRLENKYGHLALEGLIKYVALLMGLVFFLNGNNMLPYWKIDLNISEVLGGEVWRLITFPLIPISNNFLFLFFELSILFMCAEGLEANWGTFKLTVYYVSGMIFIILASFILYYVYSISSTIGLFKGSYFIYLSLFLGYATLYPDYEILLFLILPIKVKYIAMFSLFTIVLMALQSKILIIPLILSLGNYLLFFGPVMVKNLIRNEKRRQNIKKFEAKLSPETDYRHKCAICGKTDVDDPELQFRYCTCSDCGDDGVAYCLEHLKEHKEKSIL